MNRMYEINTNNVLSATDELIKNEPDVYYDYMIGRAVTVNFYHSVKMGIESMKESARSTSIKIENKNIIIIYNKQLLIDGCYIFFTNYKNDKPIHWFD